MDAPPAEVEQARAALRVVIVDDGGLPVPGVRVALDGSEALEAFTDPNGVALLEGLPAGWRALSIEKSGFIVQHPTVHLVGGQVGALSVMLELQDACCVDPMGAAQVLPEAAAGGADLYADVLHDLPTRGLGGVAGLAAWPALGLDPDERGPWRLEGLALPEEALAAMPIGVVGDLEARRAGLDRSGGDDLDLNLGDEIGRAHV